MNRRNNFDLIRLVAALAVVTSHSVRVTEGRVVAEPLQALTGHSLGTVAVIAFMATSGYLVTASAMRSDVWCFLRARALRVYPALSVVVLAVFVASWLVTGSPHWPYLLNLTGFNLTTHVPGVFETNPDSFVNAPLWSLIYEIWMYVLVAAAMIVRGVRPRVTFVAWALALAAATAWPSNAMFYLGLAFLSGSLLFQTGAPMRGPVAVACALGLIVASQVGAFMAVLCTCGTYLVIYAAFTTRPVTMRWGDVSYGTYIWAWPVQQTVVYFGGPMPWWVNVGLSLPPTLLLAAGSWWLVERWALRLKGGAAKAPPVVTAQPAHA